VIEIRPTRIIIKDYIKESCKELEHSLSVWSKLTYSYTFCAYDYNEVTKELTIPSGFDLNKLAKYFPNKEIVYNNELKETRKIKNLTLKFPPNKPIQEEAIKFLLGTKYTRNSTQKMLSLKTGQGKTYCAINYVSQTLKVPLIVVDQDSLAQQWLERIKHFTNAKDSNVFIISGRDSINKLLKMPKKDFAKVKFFIAIHRTINALIHADKALYVKLIDHLGIGVKIFDEAHVEFANIFAMDSLNDIESIYLTATPSRSNESENKVYQNMFYNVKRMNNIKRLSEENYHNIVIVKTNSKPSIDQELDTKSKFGFDVNKFSKYILEERYEHYFNIIMTILTDIVLKKEKKKTIIIFHINDLVDTFYKDFSELVEKTKAPLSVGKFNSSIKDRDERFRELEKDIVITTDKSFSKGIDVKNLECVINTVPLSSAPKTEQMIGRLRRLQNKEVYYFDVIDSGFKSCLNQLTFKNKVYQKTAKEIYEIKL